MKKSRSGKQKMRMIIFFIGLLMCLIVKGQQQQQQFTNEPNRTECMIYSDIYRSYLFAKINLLDLVGLSRGLGMWIHYENRLDYNSIEKSEVYYFENDPTGIWIFEPVLNRTNTFYIRNKKYNDEFLVGTESYQEWINKKNRVVVAQKRISKQENDEEFMWKLSQRVLSNDTFSIIPNTFSIWNVKLELPMFVRTFSRFIGSTMVVNLADERNASSNAFAWILRCQNNSLPIN